MKSTESFSRDDLLLEDFDSIHSVQLSSDGGHGKPSSPIAYARTQLQLVGASTQKYFEHSPSVVNRGVRSNESDAVSEEASAADEPTNPMFDEDGTSMVTRETSLSPGPSTSEALEGESSHASLYPPPPLQSPEKIKTHINPARKIRPESLIVQPPGEALVLGVALVDFNHQLGPQIEWSQGIIFQDTEIARILPFLALPDGAHMNVKDFSYFHLVPSSPHPRTVFGISCNRQIDTSSLLVRNVDVTRSTVQKAVVVVATRPLFGPVRYKSVSGLFDWSEQRMNSLHAQSRNLIRTFRHRTLVLFKALVSQKKILFYGHPVELLCTYQYSLVSLVPGLLQSLEDCGSPPLSNRAFTLSPPNSLKTSDRKSLLAYLGLPLEIFGKDAFFQPYLPLQQMDLLHETTSWLCGMTNSIVTQMNDVDILINIEEDLFQFRNPQVEKAVSLTAADRAWIDEIVRDVNDTWEGASSTGTRNLLFKGSEDYIRTKFEEYIYSALSAVRYHQFLAKGERAGVAISGGSVNDSLSWDHFQPSWLESFKNTNAYEVWNRITDSMIFDIVEPSHPGAAKTTTISDIGLRIQEGLIEMKLEQQLAPTREALNTAFNTGTTSLLKAMDGVRGRWAVSRRPSSTSVASLSETGSVGVSTPVEFTKADVEESSWTTSAEPNVKSPSAREIVSQAGSRMSSWGSGLGSFISSRTSRFSLGRPTDLGSGSASTADAASVVNSSLSVGSAHHAAFPDNHGEEKQDSELSSGPQDPTRIGTAL